MRTFCFWRASVCKKLNSTLNVPAPNTATGGTAFKAGGPKHLLWAHGGGVALGKLASLLSWSLCVCVLCAACAWWGLAVQAIAHLEALGHACPREGVSTLTLPALQSLVTQILQVNPADFLIDLISVHTGGPEAEQDRQRIRRRVVDGFSPVVLLCPSLSFCSGWRRPWWFQRRCQFKVGPCLPPQCPDCNDPPQRQKRIFRCFTSWWTSWFLPSS